MKGEENTAHLLHHLQDIQGLHLDVHLLEIVAIDRVKESLRTEITIATTTANEIIVVLDHLKRNDTDLTTIKIMTIIKDRIIDDNMIRYLLFIVIIKSKK